MHVDYSALTLCDSAVATAAAAAGIVTTPLDVLKTRLMTQGTSGRYKNLIDATIQVRLQTARFSLHLQKLP
jgi:hypothetical protein